MEGDGVRGEIHFFSANIKLSKWKSQLYSYIAIFCLKHAWIYDSINLISWNGGEPKYEIRQWVPNHAKMGKGVSFTPWRNGRIKATTDKMAAQINWNAN